MSTTEYAQTPVFMDKGDQPGSSHCYSIPSISIGCRSRDASGARSICAEAAAAQCQPQANALAQSLLVRSSDGAAGLVPPEAMEQCQPEELGPCLEFLMW